MFLGDTLEGFRDVLDAVGQPVVVLDRQRADDLLFAAGGVAAVGRFVIDVLPGHIFMIHAFLGAGRQRARHLCKRPAQSRALAVRYDTNEWSGVR